MLTIREIRVTQVQILAGPCWVVLSAKWVLHLLDLQLQRIQRAKDLLHAIVIVLVICIGVRVIHELAGINVPPAPLGARLDWQRVDDITRGTLWKTNHNNEH